MNFGAYSQRKFRSGNFVDGLADLRARANMQDRTEYRPHAYDILEDFIQNRFVSPLNPDITEPTDAGFIGVFLSAVSQALADGNFWFAQLVVANAVRYGIGDEGEFIRGLDFLSNHYADVNGFYRRARRGMQEVNLKPALMMEFLDNGTITNKITTNPAAESGSTTGWTVAGTVAANSVDPIDGSYDFKFSLGASLTSSKYAVTAGLSYRGRFTETAKMVSDGTVRGELRWYDASSAYLGNNYIYNDTPSDVATEHSAIFTAPTGATQVEFYIFVTGITLAPYVYADLAAIEEIDEYAYTRWEDAGVFHGDETEEVNALGIAQSKLQFSVQMQTGVVVATTVDSSYMWGFYRGPASANSADGQEYLFQFDVLAAGTYELHTYGNANLNCGIVDYYLDGSSTPFATGQDWYLASAGVPTEKTITGVVIETGGRHVVKVKVNGKSGTTYYRWLPTALWFVSSVEYTVRATPPVTVLTYDYLLLESGDFLLLENGDQIILE